MCCSRIDWSSNDFPQQGQLSMSGEMRISEIRDLWSLAPPNRVRSLRGCPPDFNLGVPPQKLPRLGERLPLPFQGFDSLEDFSVRGGHALEELRPRQEQLNVIDRGMKQAISPSIREDFLLSLAPVLTGMPANAATAEPVHPLTLRFGSPYRLSMTKTSDNSCLIL